MVYVKESEEKKVLGGEKMRGKKMEREIEEGNGWSPPAAGHRH